METLLIAVGAGVGYLIAYHTYGRWLARKIFRLDPQATVPSVAFRDDRDYVPTNRSIVFGHHFTSIAGTGPIVGPAIAVMWGWLPALVWVLLGSILIGAVHDFGALVVSLRSGGQTVGDVAGRVMNRRVRLLFLLILFMALTIVLAIFGLVIAGVFKQYPAAIFPCLVQIPIALVIGVWLHRRQVNLLIPSLLALAAMYVTLIFGNEGVLGGWNQTMAGWSTITWVGILLAYSYVASVLPVWTLLQPRDYINSLQLITALGLVVVGLLVAGLFGGAPPTAGTDRVPLEIAAPMIRANPAGAPAVIPFLFITIACGACSGFHCLVSSGTSSKQIKCESDAQFVGYGSMLTEGFLATLVILSCVAGLGLGVVDPATEQIVTGTAAYDARYETWTTANGLAAKVGAFVDGSANFLVAMSIPPTVALAIMGVLVASFAGTTLDTACRLQRYVIQELATTFAGPHPGSAAAGRPRSALLGELQRRLDDAPVGLLRVRVRRESAAARLAPLAALPRPAGALAAPLRAPFLAAPVFFPAARFFVAVLLLAAAPFFTALAPAGLLGDSVLRLAAIGHPIELRACARNPLRNQSTASATASSSGLTS